MHEAERLKILRGENRYALVLGLVAKQSARWLKEVMIENSNGRILHGFEYKMEGRVLSVRRRRIHHDPSQRKLLLQILAVSVKLGIISTLLLALPYSIETHPLLTKKSLCISKPSTRMVSTMVCPPFQTMWTRDTISS